MGKRLVRGITFLTCGLLFLSACAGPNDQPLADTGSDVGAVTGNQSKETPAPPPERTEVAAAPKAKSKVGASSQTKIECSSAPLEESLVLRIWENGYSSQVLVPYDPEIGAPLCERNPVPAGKDGAAVMSPDRSVIAFSFTKYEDFHDGRLHFIDLKTWNDIPTSIETTSWISAMVFSPDSRRLAITYGSPEKNNQGWPKDFRILMVDVNSQAVLSETTTQVVMRTMAFSQDGSTLMVYGTDNLDGSAINSSAHALLLDPATLKPLWDQTLDGVLDGEFSFDSSENSPPSIWWQPAVVFSPHQNQLLIVHADEDKLTTVDFGTRTVKTGTIQPKTSLLDRLLSLTAGVAYAKFANGTMKQGVLSPDGTRLYVVGTTTESHEDSSNNMEVTETSLGLQVIDTRSGSEIAQVDTEATSLAVSTDGKMLFLQGWGGTSGWTDRFNADTLKVEGRLRGRSLRSAVLINGETVILSITVPSEVRTYLAVMDPNTWDERNEWQMMGVVELVAP